ncbi:MAG: efflux RND transporter periplasmic adaptor subunit, partial [Gemmatimonadales bacterium]
MNRTILITILAAAGASACAQRAAPPPAKVPVSVVRAERRDVPFTVTATGTVEPARTVSVTAQIGGLLRRVHFAEGDEVREGQILFEIDPRPYEAALQQADANLGRDVAQYANAVRESERARTLAAGGLGTTEDAQAKQATEDALAATVRADSAALLSARLNLEYATVRAPISGRTGSLLVKEGNLVVISTPQNLVTINQI